MRAAWLPGWRALGLFWGGVGGIVVGVGALLMVLGAPPRHGGTSGTAIYHGNNNAWPGPPRRQIGSPVLPPDAKLLEPAPDFPGYSLPKIGPGGRRPGQYYAAFSNAADPEAKVTLIVGGIGLDRADSTNAIRELPSAIDLAISAYADTPARTLDLARGLGHEFLLSLPMEPAGYPSNDEGDHALLTSATPAENARNLEWAMSRIEGYVGVTGASDGQRGERYAESPALMGAVAEELNRRGLFYIDPRQQADAPDQVISRSVDLVIDEPAEADDIDSKLIELVQIARQHGSSIGLVGRPSPVAVARILAWTRGLPQAGVSLIPVSALLQPAAHAGP